MNRFNLTFRGEIKPGRNPRKVKAAFASLFGLDDPARVEPFFSGETVILRRNLDRKEAGDYYHKLDVMGLRSELVRVKVPAPTPAAPPNGATRALSRAEREAAAEEAAAWQRAQEEKRRQREQEARARRRAEQEALQQQQEKEAAARALAEQERRRRERAEAEARRKAEAEARQKAEEAARRKAERQRLQRERAEAEARRKAAQEQRRREQAEAEARRRAEQERQRRQRAEEAARQRAEQEEKKRRQAEAAAKKKAEREAQKRKEAEASARRRAEERARQQAEREAKKRREAEAAELAARQRAEEKARREALAREEAAQLAAMEEQPIRRAAQHFATPRKQTPRPAGRVSRLVGTVKAENGRSRDRTYARSAATPGAPNLYRLKPFRNHSGVRERARFAQLRQRKSLQLAAVACLLLAALGWIYDHQPLPPAISGPGALAVSDAGRLLIALPDRLLEHDRAGVPMGEMRLGPEGILDGAESLLLAGADQLLLTTPGGLQQCSLEAETCQPLASVNAGALARDPLSGDLLVVSPAAGALLRLDSAGNTLASVELPLPAYPGLVLQDGLLYMNSPGRPAISVFRYEREALGKQLDEILLLPPTALARGLDRVRAFLWADPAWWVLLQDQAETSSGLYRFDNQWNFTAEVTLPAGIHPTSLLRWGNRVLAPDPHSLAIPRFNLQGQAEAPLRSPSLVGQAENRQRWLSLARWGAKLLAVALVAVLVGALADAWLQGQRQRVYRGVNSRGALPLENMTEGLHWLRPASPAQHGQARYTLAWSAVAALALAGAYLADASALQLAGLLLLLIAPLLTLSLMQRARGGHLGINRDQLLLVDHRQLYHHGRGAQLQFRGDFVMVEDVVLFLGNRWLPRFEGTAAVRKLARAGTPVSRTTLLVKLLQARHPLARITGLGFILCAAGVLLLFG